MVVFVSTLVLILMPFVFGGLIYLLIMYLRRYNAKTIIIGSIVCLLVVLIGIYFLDILKVILDQLTSLGIKYNNF